jgi:hypothetical protein
MLLVDIFTRKLYAYLMRNKNEKKVLDVLQLFLKSHHPDIITSDNESAFAGNAVQKLMAKHEVISDMVEPMDHKALGVVDRAVQTVKNAIFKFMKDENTTVYSKELPRIIEAYNATPNSGILDIAPEDAHKKENVEALQILNNNKDKKNRKFHVEFAVGDTVRKKLKQNAFTRSYDEKYSQQQYTIEDIHDGRAFLSNGDDVSLRFLIHVEKVRVPEKNVLAQAKKEAKVKKAIKKENLEIKSKGYDVLPEAKTRAQGVKHLSSDGKALSKQERYKYTDIDTAQILKTKRRG